MATYFFCGIGGIGMSSIALYLSRAGHSVLGSDRAFDQDVKGYVRETLEKTDIKLFPQDGSGVTKEVDVFVVSAAVEDSILDVKKAKELNIPILKRAEILAQILHDHKGIAIAGTSGKTTVTAMVGHILYSQGLDPVMINGGISINQYHNEPPSNMIFGKGDYCVIEADESDGSIELYSPQIGVVTSVSLDHKPVQEMMPLFEDFVNKCKIGAVLNLDCAESKKMKTTQKNILTFSLQDPKATFYAENIRYKDGKTYFDLKDMLVEIPLIGKYNVKNALAAIGVCALAGIPAEKSVQSLVSFLGTKRRLETVGAVDGTVVIDDYAHNPEKIQGTLCAIKDLKEDGHMYFIYQPHGFAPLRLMKDELTAVLKKELDDQTTWIMTDVFYVGGTTNKNISPHQIVEDLKKDGKDAHFIPTRDAVIPFLVEHIQPGDKIVVMGARDNTLSYFAQDILEKLRSLE
ncbi:MAG: Mur ligase domain-containing protein [Lactobacillales bacterium]|jgi:UDP-N-acetylmuramate--alanine ligase|nr:Mur ligase domain-containing protein [Lactobacillales bacterium]